LSASIFYGWNGKSSLSDNKDIYLVLWSNQYHPKFYRANEF